MIELENKNIGSIGMSIESKLIKLWNKSIPN